MKWVIGLAIVGTIVFMVAVKQVQAKDSSRPVLPNTNDPNKPRSVWDTALDVNAAGVKLACEQKGGSPQVCDALAKGANYLHPVGIVKLHYEAGKKIVNAGKAVVGKIKSLF